MYGKIEYDKDGKPICEICGKAFSRVLSHVRQAHDMSEREYKLVFGFDVKKGICSKESALKSREKALLNYDIVIKENLINKGSASRFKKGSSGRTKDQVSEQTRLRLKERLKSPEMIEKMKASGRKVGLSGLGNKAKWGGGST